MESDDDEYFGNIGQIIEPAAAELSKLELFPMPKDQLLSSLYRSICSCDSAEVEQLLSERPELVSDTRSQISLQQRVRTPAGATNAHRIDILQATPLHAAAAVTDAAAVRCLLRLGADAAARCRRFSARINKAHDSNNADVELEDGTALHIAVLLDSVACVRELTSPQQMERRVRRALLTPQTAPLAVEEVADFVDARFVSLSVDSQFEFSSGSALQLAALLGGKAMARQSLLKLLQYRTMELSLLRQETPFDCFKHLQRFATDEMAVLDDIEQGYALHLSLSMRCSESVTSLLEFDDLYEILVDAVYDRLLLVRRLLSECDQRKIGYSVDRVNEFLKLPDCQEFTSLWFNIVLPAVGDIWTEIVEDTSFDLKRLKQPMQLEPEKSMGVHRLALKRFAENLSVLKSPIVINQIHEDVGVLRDIGFYLLRLNRPDLSYLLGGNQRRPLDFPVLIGDVVTTKALLRHGAKATYIQNLWKMKDNEIVRCMVSQPHWLEYFKDRANPCRIFDSEPELAMAMMDKWVQVKKAGIDDEFGCQFEKVVLNYEFFDSELKKPRKEGVAHPILTMVRRNLTDMLLHPLVYRYIHRVFPAVFLLYLLLFTAYFVFNILFTGHLINVSIIKEQQNSEDLARCMNSSVLNIHDMRWYRENYFWTVGVVSYIEAFVIFFLVKELLQLVVRKLDYFGPGNMIDLFVFVSILSLTRGHRHLSACQYYSDAQWQLAAVVLFFTWFNVFLYFRKFPVLGVYIVMFLEVLRSTVKFFVLFSVLVLSFAAQFHILLGNQPRFSSFVGAGLKVFVMAMGELTFEELFLDDQKSATTLVAYDGLSRVVFVVFAVIIGIVTMNLLVGLAVDDIANIQQKAQLKRLALQADLSVSILARLHEFKRKMKSYAAWWLSPKRKRRELLLASAAVVAFSFLLLPVLTVVLLFSAMLLVLRFFRFFQMKKEEFFRLYTQRYTQKWYSVLFSGIINSLLSVESEDDFREQVAAMKQRKKTCQYYPEDSDSDEEEKESLRQLQAELCRVELKLDALLQLLPGRLGRQASVQASRQVSTQVGGQAAAWPGDRGQQALLNLTSDSQQQSTKDLLEASTANAEAEPPFHRFRRVTMRQRRRRDRRRRMRMEEERSDSGSDSNGELEEEVNEEQQSDKIEVHLLPKSRVLGKG